jgi:hypothetical protein
MPHRIFVPEKKTGYFLARKSRIPPENGLQAVGKASSPLVLMQGDTFLPLG